MESKNLHIIEHPLIQHKVSLARNKTTGNKEFRELINEIAMLLTYEATRDLPMKEVEIETPVAVAKTKVISGKKLAIVPIIRAGMAMEQGVLELIPAAKVGHIGIYRDPETMEAKTYFHKLPYDITEREVIVLDPMLATGSTTVSAVDIIKKAGVKAIKLMCIIASPEGLERFTSAHPDVQIFCACIDKCLNEKKYIVPGLGDAGDRIYGTK